MRANQSKQAALNSRQVLLFWRAFLASILHFAVRTEREFGAIWSAFGRICVFLVHCFFPAAKKRQTKKSCELATNAHFLESAERKAKRDFQPTANCKEKKRKEKAAQKAFVSRETNSTFQPANAVAFFISIATIVKRAQMHCKANAAQKALAQMKCEKDAHSSFAQKTHKTNYCSFCCSDAKKQKPILRANRKLRFWRCKSEKRKLLLFKNCVC